MENKPMNFDQVLINMKHSGVFPTVLTRVFLFGPPGTGKSTIGITLFGRGNVERVSMSEKTPIEDLLGMMTLTDSGSIKWIDGPAAKAMREGKCLIIDEINRASPAMHCTLHALLDNPAGITLPSGERIEAAPGYCVIGTSNEAPSALPSALQDRFELMLPALEASEGLKSQLGSKGREILDNVNARMVEEGAARFEWRRPVTPRLLLTVEALLKNGLTLEQISKYLFTSNEALQADFLALYA